MVQSFEPVENTFSAGSNANCVQDVKWVENKILLLHVGRIAYYRRSFCSDRSPYTGVANPKPPDTVKI